MTIPYQDILLWGHSLDAYCKMFALNDSELNQPILDYCGGPSSFNAELTAKGGQVVSVDPLFALSDTELEDKIEIVFAEMLSVVTAHKDRFHWESVESPRALAALRHENIELFLRDFPKGVKQGRYLAVTPPDLPFKHFQFHLALCSHFLFANCPEITEGYHLACINQLCDVAKEVRIFPLLDSKGEIPDIVGSVTQGLHELGLGVEIKAVPYQFQKKGNAMLRVWAQTCEVEKEDSLRR